MGHTWPVSCPACGVLPSFLSDRPTRPAAFSQEGSQASPPPLPPVVLFCSSSPLWVLCSPAPSTLGGGSSDLALTDTRLGLESFEDGHPSAGWSLKLTLGLQRPTQESPQPVWRGWRNKGAGLAALGQLVEAAWADGGGRHLSEPRTRWGQGRLSGDP